MLSNQITRNTLFYGDNLKILREYFPDESVDLIYLDPPFNSNRSYNILFKEETGQESEAQIKAFDDTWHWNPIADATFREIVKDAPHKISKMMQALKELIGENQMLAYLVMMTIRLVELYRVLKPTGSIYLHCDPTASHYLKIVLDSIFGFEYFRNEITWKRTSAHNDSNRYGRNTDRILYYTKSNNYIFNPICTSYSEEYIRKTYNLKDSKGYYKSDDLTGAGVTKGESSLEWHGYNPTEKGRHWAIPTFQIENLVGIKKAIKLTIKEKLDLLLNSGYIYFTEKGTPRFKRYLDAEKGVPLQELWADFFSLSSQAKERLGYPTQKPVELLDRIISVSSNEGDIVFDPFCGCGTAIAAAEKLHRKWVGIDITHLAVALQKYRLQDSFGLKPRKDYDVLGEPEDLESAKSLAEQDRFQFQYWAVSLVNGKPVNGQAGSKKGKKGADRGIDGMKTFEDLDDKGNLIYKSVLIQVKSGTVKSGDIRDFRGTIERENAPIGLFITLENPTKPMLQEAQSAGYYSSKAWGKEYPKIQILTIEELLAGSEIKMPDDLPQFKKAKREPNNNNQKNIFDNDTK